MSLTHNTPRGHAKGPGMCLVYSERPVKVNWRKGREESKSGGRGEGESKTGGRTVKMAKGARGK